MWVSFTQEKSYERAGPSHEGNGYSEICRSDMQKHKQLEKIYIGTERVLESSKSSTLLVSYGT